MATLTLAEVSKTYTPKGSAPELAVNRVSFEVANGEIVGLLGSSGCGKTSILRMVAGFEKISAGEIRLDGQTINSLPPSERNIAMAFEGYALYPPLSVEDNIAFGLLRYKIRKSQADEQVKSIAAMLGITDILKAKPAFLASGQQQLVSLARALIRPAAIHLLDEPMSQLEPQVRTLLRARIKDYLTAQKCTTIFVTHDQTEAMAMANRIVVMSNGVLQQMATPDELKQKPGNVFVASFIGEPPMNLFPARLRRNQGGVVIEMLDEQQNLVFALPLTPTQAQATDCVGKDGKVVLGLRPHQMKVQESPDALPGILVSNQWLGDQSQLVVDIKGVHINLVTDDQVDGEAGRPIPILMTPAATYLFDASTEAVLLHGDPLR